VIDWEPFWCCFNAPQQNVVLFMGTFAPIPFPFALKTVYDAVWVANIGAIDTDWYNYWMIAFGLTVDEVEVEPDVFVEAVIWDLGNYLSYLAFTLTSDFLCPTPCSLVWTFFRLPV